MERPHYDSPLAFVAIQAALHAGSILRKGFGSKFLTSTKENPLDLVTEYDTASEKSIIDFISEHYPTHCFLAEESGYTQDQTAPVQWIIDPLDGTMNFAHQIPSFSVSIAAKVGSNIDVGVIYLPMSDELFVGQRGRGAYLNGRRLSVSTLSDVNLAIASTGFPYGRVQERSHSLDQFNHMASIGNPIRMIGSATISLAYIAAGRFDLFWSSNIKPWDAAAGKLLIEEAGGRVTHYDGHPHDMFKGNDIVATNSILHEEMLKFLK